MKSYKGRTLGIQFNVLGPETETEYNEKAGPNGAVERAIQADLAWDYYPTAQRALVDQITSLTGVTRRVNEAATAKKKAAAAEGETVEDVLESIPTFYANAIAQKPEAKALIAAALQAYADEHPIDPTPSARAGKVGAEYLEIADEILEAGKAEQRITKMRDYLGDDTADVDRDSDGNPTKASLARLLQAYAKKRMSED